DVLSQPCSQITPPAIPADCEHGRSLQPGAQQGATASSITLCSTYNDKMWQRVKLAWVDLITGADWLRPVFIPDGVDPVLPLGALIATFLALSANLIPKNAMSPPGPRRRALLERHKAIRAKLVSSGCGSGGNLHCGLNPHCGGNPYLNILLLHPSPCRALPSCQPLKQPLQHHNSQAGVPAHGATSAHAPVLARETLLSGHKEPGYWLCPICKFGSKDFKTTMRQSAHSDLIRVHWRPTLEPAPLITAHLDYTAQRNIYDEENRTIQEARHARPDANLPDHTRQGLPDPHTWLPRCTNLHSKATFHTPETTTYWSPDINDTAFGAHHNCLLVRHTGLSTWDVPADDAVALKCVNHAIHSATQEEAMATIMLIPGKKGISYPKHIDTLRRYPEYCQHLASIPPTKTTCSKPGKHAKLHIYVIWNAAGQQLVTKGNPQGWLASTATALHPQRDTHPIHKRPTNQGQPATPPSGHNQHMRLPLDRDLPTAGHERSHQQLTQHSTTQPRMAITEWATLAYTDGSCIKTSGAAPASVGAGVYIPETNVLITVTLDDPESNTINKAELTAIHAALTAGAKRIATDSLCSIYQIRRALANPMSLITHRHNDILTAIATLIIDSPVTIHFYKHAALHPELANTPAYRPTTRTETNTWLNNEADGNTPAPLPDCRHSVRAHMHRRHSLGLANQDSIYYQMSQEITKAAAKGAGERVMTDTNISIPAQRTALLYRTGGLYNQKLAMRWKRATDDRCPLCGEADSATHLLSGCSETLPMVQERHNGAGRLIAKAISKGTLGGYISFADTGSWEKGAKDNLDLPNDTLHTTLRALGLKTATTKNTTRPDTLMVIPTMKTGKRGKAIKRVIIIEIKYCSDSRWTDQLDKALTQHTHLAQTIRKEDHMVEIVPILLGIGGITAQQQLSMDQQELQGARLQLTVHQQQLQDAQHQLALDKQQLQGAQHQLSLDQQQLKGAQHQLSLDQATAWRCLTASPTLTMHLLKEYARGCLGWKGKRLTQKKPLLRADILEHLRWEQEMEEDQLAEVGDDEADDM
ncbi:hypothetical protein QJQ45_019942, partial [Haematococcus lacustris]